MAHSKDSEIGPALKRLGKAFPYHFAFGGTSKSACHAVMFDSKISVNVPDLTITNVFKKELSIPAGFAVRGSIQGTPADCTIEIPGGMELDILPSDANLKKLVGATAPVTVLDSNQLEDVSPTAVTKDTLVAISRFTSGYKSFLLNLGKILANTTGIIEAMEAAGAEGDIVEKETQITLDNLKTIKTNAASLQDTLKPIFIEVGKAAMALKKNKDESKITTLTDAVKSAAATAKSTITGSGTTASKITTTLDLAGETDRSVVWGRLETSLDVLSNLSTS